MLLLGSEEQRQSSGLPGEQAHVSVSLFSPEVASAPLKKLLLPSPEVLKLPQVQPITDQQCRRLPLSISAGCSARVGKDVGGA